MGADRFPLIILAGGKGERAGGPKGLIEYHGRPWLRAQLAAFRDVSDAPVVIVLGHFADDYFRAMPELRYERVVVNPCPVDGQFSSLQVGLRALDGGAVFILPVDVPVADVSVWRTLAGSMRGAIAACVPIWQERGGHPVLLSENFGCRLLALPRTARLDERIRALDSSCVRRVCVEDARVCMNINSAEQFERLIRGAYL